MLKLRTISVCAVAIFALSAILATAAQAANTVYFSHGAEITSEKLEPSFEAGTTNQLKGAPFGVAVDIKCTTRTLVSGLVGSAGEGDMEIEYEGCSPAIKPANCNVAEPIIVKADTQAELNGSLFETQFKSIGTSFTTITLTGASCALRSAPFTVEGTQKCENGAGAENEQVSHELTCGTVGSSLKAGGKVASFESSTATVELESAKAWKFGLKANAWSSTKTYLTGEVVEQGASCYSAKLRNLNVLPPAASVWKLLASCP